MCTIKIKINNLQGDLSDISDIKTALVMSAHFEFAFVKVAAGEAANAVVHSVLYRKK